MSCGSFASSKQAPKPSACSELAHSPLRGIDRVQAHAASCAVERAIVARRQNLLLTGQLLRVETYLAGQGTVGGDLVRGQADPRDALLDLRCNEHPQQAVDDKPCYREQKQTRNLERFRPRLSNFSSRRQRAALPSSSSSCVRVATSSSGDSKRARRPE